MCAYCHHRVGFSRQPPPLRDFITMNPRPVFSDHGHPKQDYARTHGRGGMRVGEVLNLTPADIQERTLAIQNPKSGRTGETVYVPRKLLVRLSDYIKARKTGLNDRIFPISYVAAWSMVKKGWKSGRY